MPVVVRAARQQRRNDRVAARTPGTVRRRSTPCSKNRVRYSASYSVDGNVRTNTRLLGSYPKSTWRRLSSVRKKRPAPTRSTREIATWATRSPRLSIVLPCATLRLLLLQRGARVDACRANGWCDAEDPPTIAVIPIMTPSTGRSSERHGTYGGGQQGLRPIGDQDSGGAAKAGEQQAFGEQLADKAAAGGAHRQAYRQLPLPDGGAREQQVRDVRAHQQQDESDDDADELKGSCIVRVGVVHALAPAVDDEPRNVRAADVFRCLPILFVSPDRYASMPALACCRNTPSRLPCA